ncbi:MAG: cobalt-precorrin 5A hydrolase [Firmicutes bacterium]|nr:cobalt-precorrin 5A hydrolase [Bacillota bacterium]
MKTAVIALTRKGSELALKIGYALNTDVYIKNELINKCVLNGDMVLIHPFATDFGKLVKKIFPLYEGLVFIMACGIVVRSISPYLKSKMDDPAVVVVDEMGRFSISLLSGHMGGANKLAEKVSAVTGGIPVITTATDINNVIAFDVFARENGCTIENISCLKYISSELVDGGSVSLYTDCNLRGILPPNIVKYEAGQFCKMAVALSNRTDMPVVAEKVLILRPKNLILGIGCKKGKTREEIESAVVNFLQRNGKSILSVRRVASIGLKARETGIIDFCKDRGIEFVTYPAERIKPIEEKFKTSEFVRKVTGVGNIAESCAVLAGENARLVCSKTVYDGITLALAEEERSYTI